MLFFAFAAFFLSAMNSALIKAVMGTDRITPMLLAMPLMTSIAIYAELKS